LDDRNNAAQTNEKEYTHIKTCRVCFLADSGGKHGKQIQRFERTATTPLRLLAKVCELLFPLLAHAKNLPMHCSGSKLKPLHLDFK
jgi:hypothetical protein